MIIDTESTIVHNDIPYVLALIDSYGNHFYCDEEYNEDVIMFDFAMRLVCDNAFAKDALMVELTDMYNGKNVPWFISAETAYGYGCLIEQGYFENE